MAELKLKLKPQFDVDDSEDDRNSDDSVSEAFAVLLQHTTTAYIETEKT